MPLTLIDNGYVLFVTILSIPNIWNLLKLISGLVAMQYHHACNMRDAKHLKRHWYSFNFISSGKHFKH